MYVVQLKRIKNEKGFSKNVLHGTVERLVPDIGMVLWTVRVQERRQVCQVCMGAVRHECGRRHGIHGDCSALRGARGVV